MRERGVTIPEIMLIGGTRVALGVGLGLLIGDKLSHDTRKGAGWALHAFCRPWLSPRLRERTRTPQRHMRHAGPVRIASTLPVVR
jgi:hypothetical protein